MSFFAKNGSFQEAGATDFEIAEAGTYTCKLIEIETSEQADFNDPTVMKPIYIFKFETVDMFDSNDRPFRFSKFTGRAYGNEKANLTILFDQMFGRRLSREEYANLDIEELMSKSWRVMVDEHKTGTGKVVNKIMSVRPVNRKGVVVDGIITKPQVQKPKPIAADADDPFQD